MKLSRGGAISAMVVGALLLLVAATGLAGGGASQPAPPAGPDLGSAALDGAQSSSALDTAIARAQQTLTDNPQDYRTWALLGSAYVEQARITVDPSYYPKAKGALDKSLAINDTSNDLGFTGMGVLSNALHEFSAAADWARKAQQINAAGSTSFGVLADALVQLGDYEGATAAVQQMLNLKPGIPSFTRASYDMEVHSNFDGAQRALETALADAYTPTDIAYIRTYLGLLRFSQGDLAGAEEQYQSGLKQTPGEPTLLLGQARVDAAQGQQDAAVAGYEEVVSARPRPEYLVEYAEYLTSLGRTQDADRQLALFRTTQELFATNGVVDYLTLAQVESNFGDPAKGVEDGQAEWARRQNVDAADALGWALHAAGRDTEALEYAQNATATSTRNALFLYHLGIIQQALGNDAGARASLDAAMKNNPYFSPLYAPRAAAALAALGGPL